MGLPARKFEQHYTYRDYRRSPTLNHQKISSDLHGQLWNHLRGQDCEVVAAPFDVFLPPIHQMDEDDVDTVVQPDLLVVCDPQKLRSNGVWGAPDLVVEILSPSTSRKDQHEKYSLYERSGVKEYWVVDPTGKWIQQYVLGSDGKFEVEVTFETKGTLVCRTLPRFTVEVESLWPKF